MERHFSSNMNWAYMDYVSTLFMKYSEHIQNYLNDLQNAEVSIFFNSAIRTGNTFISVWQPAFQASLMI